MNSPSPLARSSNSWAVGFRPRHAHSARGGAIAGAVQANAWMGAGYHVKAVDLSAERVTFHKPGQIYQVRREGDTVMWDGELVKALRHHLGLSQDELAEQLGMRQETISDWETGAYAPRRATSKHLTLFAERANFPYDAKA